ncbi:hypothetical protein EDD11_003960 [Mortierella claussenii]|nr:hypothetical protein EDD11_003960 [Mortierella claussenii]
MFTENHEWIKLDNDIDCIVEFEFEKMWLSICSPIAGEIQETNDKLVADPSLFHRSPESEGWIARIKMTAQGQEALNNMLTEEDYRIMCKIDYAERKADYTIRKIRRIAQQQKQH